MRNIGLYYLGSLSFIVCGICLFISLLRWILWFKDTEEGNAKIFKLLKLNNESILGIGFIGAIPISILISIIK